MGKYIVNWISTSEVLSEDLDKEVRQVYVWLVTSDCKVIVVSKDGDEWQLPGGKPEPGEDQLKTAVREVYEETGIDISGTTSAMHLFGYQTVKEIDPDQPEYLQVRYVQTMNVRSDEMTLGAHAEDSAQDQSDIIKYVDTVSIEDIATRVPWLEGSPELHAFKSHRLSIKASM
jgi:ADP-ribose pyrophosphatase YjhB (NUDIX family)